MHLVTIISTCFLKFLDMVGPLTILKMLHCKSLRSRTSKKVSLKQEETRGRGSRQNNINEPNIKVENSEELCRVCLREGRIPIYGDGSTEDLSINLNTFGAVEISIDDPYPKYLCQPCHALLQGAILFRKTAQQSDEIMKKSMEIQPDKETEENYNDFVTNNDNEVSYETEEQKVKVPNILSCKVCDLQFKSFQEYSDHRLSPEHENKRIICPVCKNSYVPQYFKKHMAIHKKETSFMCDICGKNFIERSHFTRHRLTHFYNLPFKCNLCPYKGRFRESLKMHMRSHTGEKPYQCELCPSRFINKSNLNKHMLIHKGQHDFRCEVCGRGFYTKRELEMHFKVDHTGIKEHVCRVCDKAFGYRKQMMKHELKVHKREKLKSGRMPLYLKVESMKHQGKDVAVET